MNQKVLLAIGVLLCAALLSLYFLGEPPKPLQVGAAAVSTPDRPHATQTQGVVAPEQHRLSGGVSGGDESQPSRFSDQVAMRQPSFLTPQSLADSPPPSAEREPEAAPVRPASVTKLPPRKVRVNRRNQPVEIVLPGNEPIPSVLMEWREELGALTEPKAVVLDRIADQYIDEIKSAETLPPEQQEEIAANARAKANKNYRLFFGNVVGDALERAARMEILQEQQKQSANNNIRPR
jgi:hypothetical protein